LFAGAAAAMPAVTVRKGLSRVPVPASLPSTALTKMAFAASPSMPSQLVSVNPRSGRSGAPGRTDGSSGAQSAAPPIRSPSRSPTTGTAPAGPGWNVNGPMAPITSALKSEMVLDMSAPWRLVSVLDAKGCAKVALDTNRHRTD
jgi:hypothetical protein